MGPRAKPIEERFWPKVRKTAGCWTWTAADDGYGYGAFRIKGMTAKAHRIAWQLLRPEQPIPDRMTLDHLCRNRKCVNPDHLEIVSRGENVLRGEGYSGQNHRKTVCKHGHPFTPENTYVYASGGRACKVCRKLRMRRYRKPVRRW